MKMFQAQTILAQEKVRSLVTTYDLCFTIDRGTNERHRRWKQRSRAGSTRATRHLSPHFPSGSTAGFSNWSGKRLIAPACFYLFEACTLIDSVIFDAVADTASWMMSPIFTSSLWSTAVSQIDIGSPLTSKGSIGPREWGRADFTEEKIEAK